MFFSELALVAGILALLYALLTFLIIRKKDKGSEKVREISGFIHKGAISYLNSQYKYLSVFVIIVAVLLYIFLGMPTAGVFIFGAFLSSLSGNIGMRVATKSNSRTAQACTKSLNDGLGVAFNSGLIMGLSVVGFGILGVLVSYIVFQDINVLFGFGFGASSVALFARVGGGIYTKAADVGADLVGKVEKGIPEDDPRNPASIADNVGDNVGDVAGMGADLFESYVDSIIAAMVLGMFMMVLSSVTPLDYFGLPLAVAALGIFSSIIGSLFVKTGKKGSPGRALNKGIFTGAITMVVLTLIVTYVLTGMIFSPVFLSILTGLVAGVLIGLSTEYYTSPHRKPVKEIAKSSETGAGTNIITGFAVGMESTIIPILVISGAILLSYYVLELYGIALAAVGMLSTLGITLAADTYGPVADNAAGIAEMAGMGKDVRKRAEDLDAVGNTTAAIGKGFAIGSAALTALALFSVYSRSVNLTSLNLYDPYLVSGVFIGGMLPFLFSSFTMKAVGRTASKMVSEVRNQFRRIKGLLQGKANPDYNRCIIISTNAALREMIIPSLIAIVAPIFVGLILGKVALGGMLLGSVLSGFLLAVCMANAGGAWDNAKKYIEAGHLGGKGSDAHKAAVVGDTVGDPQKDCSAPSINILLKLIAIISLLIASVL